MHAEEPQGSAWEEIVLSLVRVGTVLLRYRRRIITWMIIGAAIGVGVALARRPRFTATASFMPQASADANSSLRTLAGQLGVPLSVGNATQSPEFYKQLITSATILTPIAADSFAPRGDSARVREPLATLLHVRAESPAIRLERTTTKLGDAVDASVDKNTGIVTVHVTTEWRAVSIAIASRLLQAINDFNLKTRQSQAGAERRFIEGRLAEANARLRSAEDQLQGFMEHNRQLGAPRVKFDLDRLGREVSLQQQVVSTLSQSLEDARLREVRDTPVITTIESATARVEPDPRGTLMLGSIGLATGAVFGVLLAALSQLVRYARETTQPDAASFTSALNDTARELGRFWPVRRRSA